jgi:hypothetical protein
VRRLRRERVLLITRCWRPQTVRCVLVKKQIDQSIRDNRSVWIDAIAFVITYSHLENR